MLLASDELQSAQIKWSDGLSFPLRNIPEIDFATLREACNEAADHHPDFIAAGKAREAKFSCFGSLIRDQRIFAGLLAEQCHAVVGSGQAQNFDFPKFMQELRLSSRKYGDSSQEFMRALQQMYYRSVQRDRLAQSMLVAAAELSIKIEPLKIPSAAHTLLPKVFVAESSTHAATAAALYANTYIRNFTWGYMVCATGNTMLPIYEAMQIDSVVERPLIRSDGQIIKRCADARQMYFTHLDGYVDLQGDGKHGFGPYLVQHVFNRFGALHTRLIDESIGDEGLIQDEIEALRVMHNKLSRSGAPGLCFDGIGPSADPHLAFIKKGSDWNDIVNCYDLDPATVNRDVERGQPKQTRAISLGVAGMLRIPLLMLAAYGADKGHSLANSLIPCPDINLVASSLLLAASRTVIFIDKEAAAILESALAKHKW